MCPTHRWAGEGGYRGQKACHFQRKINVISQLGLLHTGTLFSRSFKQNGCVPVAPLGYPSQPLPQMKATQIIFSVFYSLTLSSFWTLVLTLTEWLKWLRKHRQFYDSPLDPSDFEPFDLLWQTKKGPNKPNQHWNEAVVWMVVAKACKESSKETALPKLERLIGDLSYASFMYLCLRCFL